MAGVKVMQMDTGNTCVIMIPAPARSRATKATAGKAVTEKRAHIKMNSGVLTAKPGAG